MKKQHHTVQGIRQNGSAPRRESLSGYVGMVCEDAPVVSESEGEENGSVCGCNANNSRASVRSVNGNNNAGNSNSNYAGAFAVDKVMNTNKGGNLTSRAASPKTTDNRTATGGYGRCDYGSLPFFDGEDNAESNATVTATELKVTRQIIEANSKRKLKGLKRFFIDKVVIGMAFDRAVSNMPSDSAKVKEFVAQKEAVCERIRIEMETMTYSPEPSRRRVVKKKGKGDKDRNVDVYRFYDRVVQMLMLIVLEHKFRNTMIRNIYSGVKGRSLLSNDRRYCMVNKIRHYVKSHGDEWAGLTDIRRFYESLRMSVVLGEMFKVVVCPFTRWLLKTMFRDTEYLPMGVCLSQLMAMYVLVSSDRELLRHFHIRLFCFGDNRLICGGKGEVRCAMSFLMSYYEGRYMLGVKDDYQMRKVCDGFRFCKYDYKGSYVSVRAEIRRRAIRAWRRGKRHYAGYKGMLDKTDSKRLAWLIENDMEITNRHGIKLSNIGGDRVKFKDLKDGTEIVPFEYRIEPSEAKRREGKEGLMVRVRYIVIDGENRRLCHSTEGSEEIVGFFTLVREGKQELKQRLHVRHDGTKSYFDEFHSSNDEICRLLCDKLGI